MLTTVSVLTPSYHTKILQYHWLYSLPCASIPMTNLFYKLKVISLNTLTWVFA